MPPTLTLALVTMLENFLRISASMILTATGDTLSILAMLSTTWIWRFSSSWEMTPAALSGST